jgi:predicted DCC family thiol-disulfide oxidoreductase YuxK
MTSDIHKTNDAVHGEPQPALVLFDGNCPLCGREIAHYRRVRGADNVRWLDIASEAAKFPIDGVDRSTAMARFHVRDSHGDWQTGAHGFVELWSHLRGYRHLSRSLRMLHLVNLLDAAYARFARWRLRHRCSDDVCSAGGSRQSRPADKPDKGSAPGETAGEAR